MDATLKFLFRRAITGAVAGAAGTATMSAVFLVGDRATAANTKPPRLLVDRFAPNLPEETADRVAVGAHFLYGIAAGKLYTLAVPPRRLGVLTGIAYGLVVWVLGYEGWMCALAVVPPAHRDRRGRALTILAAHIVYGATLGGLAKATRAGS